MLEGSLALVVFNIFTKVLSLPLARLARFFGLGETEHLSPASWTVDPRPNGVSIRLHELAATNNNKIVISHGPL